MRFLPLTEQDRADMLQAIGVASVSDLYAAVPEESRLKNPIDLPPHKGELEVEKELAGLASKNRAANAGPFFLGAGCYYHHIPAAVDAIIQRGEFLTAYTPYQPEISQGTLTAIFEFQSMIAALTGMDVANASMYDGATAVAEAALMAQRVTRRPNIHIHGHLNPEYREVLEGYLRFHEGVEIHTDKAPDDNTACVIVQTPDFHGTPQELAGLKRQCLDAGALLVTAITEIVSLGLLPPPAEADIVAGEAQSLGVPMAFGGPHLGFFACRQEYVRQMPGRLCGETVDAEGRRSFVLTLNTREQHIRREKATSNICTNQGLCALAFTVHLSLLGENGFKKLALINHERACELADALAQIPDVKVLNETFFNEFIIRVPKASRQVVDALAQKNIIAGLPLDEQRILVTATEMTSGDDIKAFVKALKEVLK